MDKIKERAISRSPELQGLWQRPCSTDRSRDQYPHQDVEGQPLGVLDKNIPTPPKNPSPSIPKKHSPIFTREVPHS